MSAFSKRAASAYLLDARYWRTRLAKLGTRSSGLLLIPRPDLSSPFCDVVEWRMRAHDGTRLWGLRGCSPFHPEPKGAVIREVESTDLPEIEVATVAEGRVDFVFQVPAGRRLEDRVLDLVHVYHVALDMDVEPAGVRIVAARPERCPDEILIAAGLVEKGLC